MEGITKAKRPPPIVRMAKSSEKNKVDWREGIIQAAESSDSSDSQYNKKKSNAFNILKAKPDFKNCHGWSLTVNHKDFHPLKGSDVSVFMVNLTKVNNLCSQPLSSSAISSL